MCQLGTDCADCGSRWFPPPPPASPPSTMPRLRPIRVCDDFDSPLPIWVCAGEGSESESMAVSEAGESCVEGSEPEGAEGHAAGAVKLTDFGLSKDRVGTNHGKDARATG